MVWRLGSLVALVGSMLSASVVPGHSAKDLSPTTSGLPIPRYVSLKSDHVNVRAGPTKDNDVAWVYTRSGLPVEITAEFENWRRVRDSEGAEGWVYHSLLSGRRTAVVTMKNKDDLASLYDRPDATSAIAARLQAGVVAQVKKCANNWCRVTGNGFDGWIEQQRLWGVYADEKVDCVSSSQTTMAGTSPAITTQIDVKAGSALLAQPHDHVDAGNLVAIRHVGHLRQHEVRVRNVDQLVIVLEIEVVMGRHVGVEIGLGAVDADLAQQAGIGQLVERVVDGRQRHRNLGQRGFLVQHFSGQVAGTLAEQQPAQRHALPGRPETGRLQHLVDVMPRAAGQGRVMPSAPGSRVHGIIVHSRYFVVHIHSMHPTQAIFLLNIKRMPIRCKFFATRTNPSCGRNLRRNGNLSSECRFAAQLALC